jgi:alpha-mannosidase
MSRAALILVLLAACSFMQQPMRPDLSRTPCLYAVATAHLDSQWLWSYPDTIGRFLPRTLRANFSMFKKYPHYIFNFTGANRYRMIKEYYPREFAMLKKYVAAGRWFPAGSSWEECDANIPSPESLIRQVLYGSLFFRREFGKSSSEFMLPDSFGFPASLPSILFHCGIKGFSTQKLYMDSGARVGGPASSQRTPAGIPFNVGYWEGEDGSGVIAALNPGRYSSRLWYDLSRSPAAAEAKAAERNGRVDWPRRIQSNGETSGIYADYLYYGRGDQGGAPQETSIRLLDAIVDQKITRLPPAPKRLAERSRRDDEQVRVGTGPVRVISATAEQMFLDILPEQAARLPRYRGELQLTNHTAGSLTSQSYVKRWNRRNEVLADAAEKASVAASWLAERHYPQEQLNEAWALALGAQFHDILAGTSSPQAYEYSWNDQILAMNQFSQLLGSALEAAAAGLDTRSAGIAVLVYNSLEYEREDIVEADVEFPGGPPAAVRVFGPDGNEVPAQVNADRKILFLARVPALGLAVFDVRSAGAPSGIRPGSLRVSTRELENERYRIRISEDGNVAGIFDKSASRELLSAPVHLEIKTDYPERWPAWNMDWQDQQREPRSRLEGPAILRVRERGPARVAVEIERRGLGSRFIQVVRLAAGDAGNRLEFANIIDWYSRESHLKAVFPLNAANPLATYNLGVGTLKRGNNDERRFEVSAQQWFDLSDAGGTQGVTVLAGSKYASDKPDDHTLRLTLIRTPGTRGTFTDQATQDFGRHEFVFGLAAHAGDWRRGRTDRQAYRLDQPLFAFQAQQHAGKLGKGFSFIRLNNERVRLLALKKAEQGSETIVRLVESDGGRVPELRVRFAARIENAREVDGQEMPLGGARVRDGELLTNFHPFQLRTFALKFVPASAANSQPRGREIRLKYDTRVAGRNGEKNIGGLDGRGGMLPAELLPRSIAWRGVELVLAECGDGKPNALRCRGQELKLPPGPWRRLFFVAASDEDRKAAFVVGGLAQDLVIQDWRGFIGQWDKRLWKEAVGDRPGGESGVSASPGPSRPRPAVFSGLLPGYIKPGAVAWFASHYHHPGGADMPYAYAYLFAYELRVPPGASTLVLPDNENICILAMTVVDRDLSLQPLRPLLDDLPGARMPAVMEKH